jgi:hypothetical protein
MKGLIGSQGSAAVKDEFLMTRLLDQYLSLFEDYLVSESPE